MTQTTGRRCPPGLDLRRERLWGRSWNAKTSNGEKYQIYNGVFFLKCWELRPQRVQRNSHTQPQHSTTLKWICWVWQNKCSNQLNEEARMPVCEVSVLRIFINFWQCYNNSGSTRIFIRSCYCQARWPVRPIRNWMKRFFFIWCSYDCSSLYFHVSRL